jgi:sugar phosphate isomerase/epimerase
MRTLGRRDFLNRSAALLPLAALSAKAAGTHRLKNIGVELYTVRNIIDSDPAGVLKAIQDEGYTEVEAIYASLPKIGDALKATKLKRVSVHIDSNLFGDNAKMEEALGKAHEWGFQYAVYPYMPVPERGGVDAIKKLAEKLNKAGEQGKKLGIHICYHNHAFEYQPMNGTILLDVLLNNTEKSLVSLELDVFWASVGGHDPVELMKQHADRIALVHLKDKAKDQKVQYNENVPPTAFKAIGQGSLNFPAILREATNIGVKHFFVEQDQTPGNPLDSLKISYNYLHKLAF